MSKYKVRCLDKVRFNVTVEANSIEEAKEKAADEIRYGELRRELVCLYDYVSVTDENGECVWENENE